MTLHNYRLLCLPATFLRDGHVCEDCLGRVPWRGVVHRCYRSSAPASATLATSLVFHRSTGSFRRVQLFLAVADFVRDKHVQAGLPRERIRVKPNFVPAQRARVGPGDYFLYLGRLSPEKGITTLLAAARPAHARLLLAGDGTERGRAAAQAGIETLGAVPAGRVPDLLAGARALVFPTRCYEGAPLAVLEAYAAGVPVLASRIGAARELVEDGTSGLLVQPDDPSAWTAAMARLCDDAEALRLGEGARRLWQERYTAERGLASLEDAYQEALVLAGRARLPRRRANDPRSAEPAASRGRRPSPSGRQPLDVVVLDAEQRQSLVAVRSLGQAGLRVGTFGPLRRSPAFRSRWSAVSGLVPESSSPRALVDAVLSLVETYGALVVLPTTDGTIEALRAHRRELEARAVLALAPEPALELAIDKSRTLALAAELGIPAPRTVLVGEPREIHDAAGEVGFPAVVKPVRSWVDGNGGGTRLVSALVVDENEGRAAAERAAEAGGSVVLQEWVSGSREAVSLLTAAGRVQARFAQVAHRMFPPLGGSSVLRESIEPPPDLLAAAERLVAAAGLEGYTEVEFRRDAAGRGLLMEINPRLSASVEVAVRAGVDFPALLYDWAIGRASRAVDGYRPGVRMRWLGGDLRWLRDTLRHQGRPDILPAGSAAAIFARDCVRPASYDYVDLSDPRPIVDAVAGFGLRAFDRLVRKRPDAGTLVP
jgi:predicted ATP-grasp superfamily ATP-dependent carboligase